MSDHRQATPCPPAPEIHLSLGFHDHQPVGNFPEVFEDHYRRAYLPFLDTMERHPGVPFSLHLTGPLLVWLGEHHPGYLVRLSRLCAAGRLEMKGGGFYEPILAAIPDGDKREQLRRLSCHLEETVGVKPEGAWIAERVWEPHLALHLAEAGLRYATLDDSHFRSVGIPAREALGYYVTEEGGRRFDLFPISKELRYLVPFQEPQATVDHLRTLAEEWRERRLAGRLPHDAPPPLAVYDDDGEKFGGWPGTHEHVYGSGWLDSFLTLLEEEAEAGWLTLTTLGAFRRRFPPLGRVYLPAGSYEEMLEWSGGYYRNFLVRYDEANLLHKRMLHTSRAVSGRMRELGLADPGSADPGSAGSSVRPPAGAPADGAGRRTRAAVLRARDHVLRSQCNDAYWHGVFGGLYLPHLRHAVYASLIEAEALVGAPMRPGLELVDLDLDGRDEVFLRSRELTVLVHPTQGGAVVCLDHLPSSFALLDTLRRRREPEHAALEALAAADALGSERPAEGAHHRDDHGAPGAAGGDGAVAQGSAPEPTAARTIHEGVRMKEPGLERLLFVDRYPRTAFLDHFYGPTVGLTALVEGGAEDLGDFADAAYALVDGRDGPPRAHLARAGSVAGTAVSIEKVITLAEEPASLEVSYLVRVEPGSGSGAEVVFSPEVNLTLLAGWAHDRYVLVDGVRPPDSSLADAGEHAEASTLTLVDESAGLRLALAWDAAHTPGSGSEREPLRERPSPRPVVYRYGVVTVSLSEDGYERIYQATCISPSWRFALDPGAGLDVRIRLAVEE